MKLKDYFGQPDTPAENSPVGQLMRKVLAKNPAMGFEMARLEANRLLDKAARRKKYTMPRVYSEEEQKQQKERLGNLKG